jgi:hypothetical protein
MGGANCCTQANEDDGSPRQLRLKMKSKKHKQVKQEQVVEPLEEGYDSDDSSLRHTSKIQELSSRYSNSNQSSRNTYMSEEGTIKAKS